MRTGHGAILRFFPPLSSLDPHMAGDRSLTRKHSSEAVGGVWAGARRGDMSLPPITLLSSLLSPPLMDAKGLKPLT